VSKFSTAALLIVDVQNAIDAPYHHDEYCIVLDTASVLADS
jgi:hypothetical protein